MSEDGENVKLELPQLWQFIHPHYTSPESEEEEEEGDENDHEQDANAHNLRPTDYVKLSKRAPRLGQLMRFLNDFEEDEDVQQLLLEKDPVTQQTLLQWAVMNNHPLLVEYLVKRLQRGAFAFDPESVEVVVYNRWEEMRAELPSPAEVAERQRRREEAKAARLAQRTSEAADDEEEEEEEEEPEPTPEELVYETLEDYHEEWGDRGVGLVKRVGELGLYVGSRRRDGTKNGLGQSLFPNGDCYTGEYEDNQREGRGVYWWAASGMMYAGEWQRQRRHGYGRMVYPDGGHYTGTWLADAKNGVGRYTYPDGSSYDGSWVNNEKHGHGVYQFTDGSSYCGSFHHNAFVSGEWRLASGTIRYMGNFDRDVPTGPGLFEHRCGIKSGKFHEEGTFDKGQWTPSTLKGSTKAAPRLEMIAPQQKQQRVPIEFGSDCNGRTMADLVRAANYPPLVQFVHSLPSTVTDAANGVELRGLEVQSMRYDARDTTRVKEVRVKPLLVDTEGKRVRALGDDVLVLKDSKTRLFVLLQESSSAAATQQRSMVVLERRLRFTAPDDGHVQLRLPVVNIQEAAGTVHGEFASVVGRALRLSLDSTAHMTSLVQPLRSNAFNTNAEESVLLYAQELHPDAIATLSNKLEAVSSHPDIVSYVAVPVDQVAALSSDAVTVIAVTTLLRRRGEATLPSSTVAPQRPPTPPAPAPLPRPELQPLYAAKEARDQAEEDDEAA